MRTYRRSKFWVIKFPYNPADNEIGAYQLQWPAVVKSYVFRTREIFSSTFPNWHQGIEFWFNSKEDMTAWKLTYL